MAEKTFEPRCKFMPMEGLIDAIVSRFNAGKGAEFIYDTERPTPGSRGPVEIVLIPEYLFRDKGHDKGLLIVVKGKGSYSWTGREPLDPFKLISSGITPLKLCQYLSVMLNALVARQRIAKTESPLQLETEKKNGHSS
jgi:hypothetical protein